MTISRYDINNANVNRHVRFRIEDDNVGGGTANTFLALKGPANVYPFYNQVSGVPTVEQELGQLRLNLVIRALSVYTIPVSVQVDHDGAGTYLVFEADEFGAYFNQNAFTVAGESWPLDATDDKHHVLDIVDRLGTGGMTTVKTKNGLQSLMNTLATVSFDGGTTGPFGDISNTGVIILPDGRSVTTGAAAPALPDNGQASGLAVTWVNVG